MDYEDDELERMRARREQRKNGSRRSAGRTNTGSNIKKTSGDTGFKSGYSGPRSSGSGLKQQRTHGKRRGPDKKKRIMIIAAEVLVLLILVVGAAGWYIYDKTFGSMGSIDFDESEVVNVNLTDDQLAGMTGYMTVACFGVDSRSVGGKQNVGKGTNADVNLICSINLDTGEIRLVSVFRDSYLNISDKNSYNKINAAYASGGPEQAVKALNKNLGLNITQYATFNWKAVADAINILGGVDIEISENEFSWINAYITETVKESGVPSTQLKSAGLVHMDGVQAVAYGRLRLGDTDYARTERQRIVMQKAFEKAKKADWATLNNVLVTIMPQLATNVTVTDLIPLARNISNYHIGETSGFPSARGEATVGKIGDCVIPQTLETNVIALHKFLFDEDDYKLPSNVKEYSKHISEATGMYKEGKAVGHVPVDQGLNASVYVKSKQKKAANAAAAEAAAEEESRKKEESSTESTADESTDESSTADSTADASSESGDGWDDEEWDDEEWEDDFGPGTFGPGSSNQSPGQNHTSQTDEDSNATGPGMKVSPTEAQSPGGSTQKPGTTAESSVSPADTGKMNNSGKADTATEAAEGPATGPGA